MEPVVTQKLRFLGDAEAKFAFAPHGFGIQPQFTAPTAVVQNVVSCFGGASTDAPKNRSHIRFAGGNHTNGHGVFNGVAGIS